MNWTSHPTLYQWTHWWHWLGYGQNAAVIQALAAVLATAAAIAAGFFAAKAYQATVQQLSLAREQLRLAHQQFETDLDHLKEEKRTAIRNAKFIYQRTVAEEDAQRPRFQMVSGYTPSGGPQMLEFKNYAATAAGDVKIYSAASGKLLSQEGQVNSNSIFRLQFAPSELKATGIRIEFRSTFGSIWTVLYKQDAPNNGEVVESVIRLYEPPELN